VSEFRCHFCGYRGYEEELLRKCEGCALRRQHAGTGVSCCPNCGIELRMKSSVVDLLEMVAAIWKNRRS